MEDITKTQTPTDQNTKPLAQISAVRGEIERAATAFANQEHTVVDSSPEVNLSSEVKDAGVEVSHPEITLTQEHFDVGIRPAEITPLQTSSVVNNTETDLSQQEAEQIIKKGAGSNLDIGHLQQHFGDKEYTAPSSLFLAVLRIKNLLRTKLIRRPA